MPPAKKETKSTQTTKSIKEAEEESVSEALGEKGFYMVNHRTVSFEEDLADEEDEDD